ncbi:acyl-CoA thioesterase [Hymenobacter crusticola]|uniref:Acyl-CoA thioesterase n=1 Tax=Hymenobacter crusticola TaxID=1770526 RepID=A0A243WK34_9BACT|nr:acyl-CoA thioesterase [Hymenobacter crusticola]OUJ76255.1 acyl-CoA thioesterase [Hymenobacter crusticola]
MSASSLLPDFRSVSYSRVTLTELMIPGYANFGGKIHGGILLSLMDKVAYAAASKHAGTYCVTVSVDGVDFLQPVEVGELVSLLASVNYVGRTSLLVGIKVIAEDVRTGLVKHTNTSYFTMVAKNDAGQPTMVPGLILDSPVDTRRFLEAIKRREFKQRYQQDFAAVRETLTGNQQEELLAKERCKFGY